MNDDIDYGFIWDIRGELYEEARDSATRFFMKSAEEHYEDIIDWCMYEDGLLKRIRETAKELAPEGLSEGAIAVCIGQAGSHLCDVIEATLEELRYEGPDESD